MVLLFSLFRIEIRTLRSGEVIMTEDSHSDAGLVFILSGSLLMSQKNNDLEAKEARADSVLYTAFPVRTGYEHSFWIHILSVIVSLLAAGS